jgi:hypothetical protein
VLPAEERRGHKVKIYGKNENLKTYQKNLKILYKNEIKNI